MNTRQHDHTVSGLGYVVGRREAVWLTGPDALDFLQRLTTGQLAGLDESAGTATVLLSDDGRVVDLLAAHRGPDGVLLVTSGPGAARVVADYLRSYVLYGDDVRVTPAQAQVKVHTAFAYAAGGAPGHLSWDADEQTTHEARMTQLDDRPRGDDGDSGPRSVDAVDRLARALSSALGLQTASAAPGTWLVKEPDAGEAETLVWVLRHPAIAGVGGWDIVVPEEAAETLAHRLERAGITPVPSAAFASARIAAGSPSYGHEIQSGGPNPLELGLAEAVDTAKGCYVGQEVVARLDTYDKVQRRLVRWHAEPDPRSGRNAAATGQDFRSDSDTDLSVPPAHPGSEDSPHPTDGWTLHPMDDLGLRGRYTHGIVTTAVGTWGLALVPGGLLAADRVLARPPVSSGTERPHTTGHATAIPVRITPVR